MSSDLSEMFQMFHVKHLFDYIEFFCSVLEAVHDTRTARKLEQIIQPPQNQNHAQPV